MEPRTEVDVECPRCDCPGKANVRHYIDAQADPKGRKELLAGKLNLYRCHDCGFTDNLPTDVFYHDPEKRFCVQYAPPWRTREAGFLDSLNDRAQPASLESNSSADAPGYLKDVHLVLNMGEMAAYVLFRERLWKRRNAVGRARTVCFSCNRSIDHGEHYYCVSRLLREKGDPDQPDDFVLEGMASMQVCADCRKKAESQPITFCNAPMPLLKLEREGFHRFAKRHASWESPRASGTPEGDSCTICRAAIGRGERYTTIELSEGMSKSDDTATFEIQTLLATVCGKCSEQYLVWL